MSKKIAYHVDRSNTLSEGKIITLDKYHFKDACEENSFFNHLFFDGVSNHGMKYLEGYDPFDKSSSLSSVILEIELELMRALYYPNNISRFKAFFAVPSLSELEKWKIVLGYNNARIYEIEYDDSAELHDANLIQFGNANIDGSYKPWDDFYYLNRYLKGDISDKPLLELLLPLPITIGKCIS